MGIFKWWMRWQMRKAGKRMQEQMKKHQEDNPNYLDDRLMFWINKCKEVKDERPNTL